MSIRVDWPGIRTKLGVLKDTPFLFILPNAGRDLLLSVTDRLKWEASYRIEGYDYSDWDDLQSSVEVTEYGLMDGVNMNELIDVLSQMLAAIQAIQGTGQYQVSCCGSVGTLTPDTGVIVGEGTVPTSYGGEPIETWEEYSNFVCGAALAWADSMSAALEQLSDLVSNGLIVVGGIALVLAVFASPVIGVLLAVDYVLASTIFATLVGMVGTGALDELKAFFQNDRQYLAELIACSSTAATAYDNLDAYLESALSVTNYEMVKLFGLRNSMNVIFQGEDADGNLVAVEPSVTCGCTPPQSFTWTFDNDSQGWTRNPVGVIWTPGDGYPEPGCLQVGSGYTCQSNNFVPPYSYTNVQLSFYCRDNPLGGTGENVTFRLHRASDGAILREHTAAIPAETWSIYGDHGDFSMGGQPETLYLTVLADSAHYLDTVVLTFIEG